MRLDSFEPIDYESLVYMFNMADTLIGQKHIDLGSGDGRMVVEARNRGLDSIGYEIDENLAKRSMMEYGIRVVIGDCFDADVYEFDLITCWFTRLPDTRRLLDKLYHEMKPGAILVKAGNTDHIWEPAKITKVNRNWLCLYKKEA